MSTYSYISSTDYREIAELKQQDLTANSPIFRYFPIVSEDTDNLAWRVKNPRIDLMHFRGLNSPTPRARMGGEKYFLLPPGSWGDSIHIDEGKILGRRKGGVNSAAMSIDDLVNEARQQVLNNKIAGQSYIGWNALLTGKVQAFAEEDSNTTLLYEADFGTNTFNGTDWSNPATSTPLMDIENAVLSGNTSVDWGAGKVHLNRKQLTELNRNTNAADLGGYRPTTFTGAFELAKINEILANRSLPMIEMIEGSYQLGTGGVQKLIPDGKVVITGVANGQVQLGNLTETNAIHRTDGSTDRQADIRGGFWMSVVEANKAPYTVDVEGGWNGGLQMWYPEAVINCNC